MAIEAFFLPAASGQRFCLFHPPAVSREDAVSILFIHAFAEEMNKSRRMAALQARALAAAGHAVLQVDLHGCGDSSGDFGDASWASWLDDVAVACDWLRARKDRPLWLFGHRAGCLLATEAAARVGGPVNLLFWQPVVSGQQFLQQFLRLKVAGEMLAGESKGVMQRLRQQLEVGEAVEVAGYSLSPALAAGLEAARLALPPDIGRIEWLELSAREAGTLAPVAEKWLEAARAAGHQVDAGVVFGPMFWQTAEIEECPALIEATIRALERRPS